MSDDAKVIRDLDNIREGRKVSVSFTQRPFFFVAEVTGSWVPRDNGGGWVVVGPKGSRAMILVTDKISVFRDNRKLHLRVDLTGRRMSASKATLHRAVLAGITSTTEGGDA